MSISRDHELFNMVIKNYWEYYRELEDEFLLTRRYVDFSEKNMGTFSVEYLKLYQAACSEIDVLGKAMAQIADSTFKPEDKKNNIIKWWTYIQDEYKVAEGPFTQFNPTKDPIQVSLQDYRCYLFGHYEIQPWMKYITEKYNDTKGNTRYRNASGSQTPIWWTSYNRVKHNRISLNSPDANYEKANLGNVIKAFAALYVLERALLDTVGTKNDLDSFTDYTVLFYKKRRLTYEEMEELYGIK